MAIAPTGKLSRDLITTAQNGDPHEVGAALDELVRRAEASGGNPEAWAEAAQGFFVARMFPDAIHILRQLVERAPEQDTHRLNLAMAYWQIEDVELCRYHLAHLVKHGRTAELRDYARAQLEQYETSLGLTSRDGELAALQERSLQEQIAAPTSYVRLGRLWNRQGKLAGDENATARVTALLEEGSRRFPQNIGILELLILCYLRHDPEGRLGDVMRALEKGDPESPVFQKLEGIVDSADAERHRRQMSGRANALLRQATKGDNAVRAAALSGLRRMIAVAPNNLDYRLTFAFALGANGAHSEALEQATLLSRQSIESHSYHFNLGQIFWLSGDPTNGRRHLEMAFRYATNEQERQDVRDRIADLENPS
jgi:tetratricopeptide (TPR) repeat protein